MGHYITLISPDGGGKDTLFNTLITHYEKAIRMYEPGGTKEADIIRHVLLDSLLNDRERIEILKSLLNENITSLCKEYLEKAIHTLLSEGLSGKTESYLYAASRAETNQKIIAPYLKTNQMILGRRSVACSMSYQGYARGIGMDKIWSLNEPTLKNATPTLEIYLDVPAGIAQERLKGRTEKQDRLDKESLDFHQKTVEGYHRYYQDYCPYPFVMVEGTLSKEELHKKVMAIIEEHLQN